MPRTLVVITFWLLGPFVLGLFSAPSDAEWHSDEQTIMGTEVVARLWHQDAAQGKAALAAAMDELRRIDRHFSPYKPDSELSRLNREAPLASAEQPLAISAELTELLHQSQRYGDLTQGAFDVTFGSVGRHYDYRAGIQPDDATRRALAEAIDYRRIHLDRAAHTVWFGHPKLYVDLGGIAKGYGVDRAIELLRERGVKHASISAGGDTRLIGDHRGRPWRVGIKNPRAPEQVAIVLPLTNEAISTSGDYERFFIDGSGERIHHILNPRTGASAQGIISATVLGPDAMQTDALSTSVFVLGLEAGLALINRQTEFEAIVITDDGRVHYSDGLVDPDKPNAE